MNDRYLYRAKRMGNGEWVQGYLFDDGLPIPKRIFVGGLIIDKYNGTSDDKWNINGIDFDEIDPSTICQCTGLRDKNGKMIWENDILRYSYDYPNSPWLTAKGLTNDDIRYSVGSVFWQEWRGSWAVCGKGKSRMSNQDVFKYCRNPNRTEVIGNIFDNSELLELEQ